MSAQTRRYVYGILVAAGAVALTYGWVTAEELPVWLALAAAVLGNGLAWANTGGRHEKGKDEPTVTG